MQKGPFHNILARDIVHYEYQVIKKWFSKGWKEKEKEMKESFLLSNQFQTVESYTEGQSHHRTPQLRKQVPPSSNEVHPSHK